MSLRHTLRPLLRFPALARTPIALPRAIPHLASRPAPIRSYSTAPSPPSRPPAAAPAAAPTAEEAKEEAKEQQPSYQLTVTCRPCQSRSTHTISKQGYHHGTVVIQCPGCKSRHLIADHLKIFGDTRRTLEDILKDNAEELKYGRLLPNGNIELMPRKEKEEENSE